MSNEGSFDEVLRELRKLRYETNASFATLRAEFCHENGLQRNETNASFATLRAELDTAFATSRAETNASFVTLRAELDTAFASVHERVDDKTDLILNSVSPMLSSAFRNLSVVGQGNILPVTGAKPATWTVIKYPKDGKQRIVAVGALHCALKWATVSAKFEMVNGHPHNQQHLHPLFVELPRELLGWPVESVGFYKPYTNAFQNHMPPVYMDIAMVLFRAGPMEMEPFLPPEAVIPIWEDRAAELTAGVIEPPFAWIIGRSLGGAVTTKDGQLEVTLVDPDDLLRGGRGLVFFLDRAEPGDSGTLLRSYDEVDNPKVLGVFRGLHQPPSNNVLLERRGAAATIPSFDKLTWLPVFESRVTEVTLRGQRAGAPFHANVRTLDYGVQLDVPAVFGIVVCAERAISYVGAEDFAVLSGLSP
jgi:hypothetical protein